MPIAKTLSLIPTLRKRFGITRVGDTTYLDRTAIPTTCAVVPTDRLLSVFNGKGATREAAIASAVMEAVERQVMADPRVVTHRSTVREVCETLDLKRLGLLPGKLDVGVDCVWGTDLLNGEHVPVPMQLIQCPWHGDVLFSMAHSNGLASGNTLTEATYHAMAELIERHIWALYHVRCDLVPRFFKGLDASDEALALRLEFPTGNSYLDSLAEQITSSGVKLEVVIMTDADLPIVAMATLVEPGSHPPMAHQGLGCSLSPSHAIARAITESIQSRVVDIQGARDDLLRADDPPKITGEHTRRIKVLPRDRWFFGMPKNAVALSDIPDNSSSDLATDVRRILQALKVAQDDRIVAVDISPFDLPVAVVRVVAPGIETTFSDGRIGPRARAFFNPFKMIKTHRSIRERTSQHDRRAN